MPTKIIYSTGILSGFLCAATIWAEPANNGIEKPDEEQLNRFSVGYRSGFNITAKFKNAGGFKGINNPGPAVGGTNHFYDDGYNLLDVSGNNGGLTWNWGYENASQLPGNDTILMHSSSSAANASSKERDDDPQHGIEFTYSRQLGVLGETRWGVEAAINYGQVEISDDAALTGNATVLTDAYQLGGVTPPLSPYHGSFDRPGPLIGDVPTRTITTLPNGAIITGRRELKADVYGFRLGPYWQVPVTEKLSALLSGGLALVVVNSDFNFDQKVTINGASQMSSGNDSDTGVLFGGYLGANLRYNLNEDWDLFGGLQYQVVGDYSQKGEQQVAELDFGNSLFFTLGIGFSF